MLTNLSIPVLRNWEEAFEMKEELLLTHVTIHGYNAWLC